MKRKEDFNVYLLKHASHNKTNDFLDTLYSFRLYPLITKPTRISTNRAFLIDNIYTNKLAKEYHNGIIYDDLSDHFPIFCISKSKVISANKHYMPRIYKKFEKTRVINDTNMLLFKEALATIDWSILSDCINANESYDNYVLRKVFDIYNHDCLPNQNICNIKSARFKRPWIRKRYIKIYNKNNYTKKPQKSNFYQFKE